jgi:hypothetical protein
MAEHHNVLRVNPSGGAGILRVKKSAVGKYLKLTLAVGVQIQSKKTGVSSHL